MIMCKLNSKYMQHFATSIISTNIVTTLYQFLTFKLIFNYFHIKQDGKIYCYS